MTDETILNACGLLCPLPVLRARKRLQKLKVGEVLTMQADDPAAVIDVPHYCQESGHILVSATEADGVQTYQIQKAK